MRRANGERRKIAAEAAIWMGVGTTARLGTAVRLATIIAVATAIGVATPGVSFAQREIEPSAAKGLEVASLRIEGLDKPTTRGLRSGLLLEGESRLLGTTHAVFYPEVLDEELARTRLYLARRGFPYARVDARIVRNGKRVDVILRIQPGPRVEVAEVSFTGVPDNLARRAEGSIDIRVGTVFSDANLERATQTLTTLLQNEGHARATVEPNVDRRDSTRVAIRFDVEPGGLVYFGEVTVTGAADDLNGLARKAFGIKSGSLYAPRDLQDGRNQLRLLSLFRQIRITPEESAPDTMDLRLEVLERDPRTIETGVGYWTDDGLRVHAGWAHRNLFRRGRGFDIRGAYSQWEYLLRASTWWPALIGPKTWLSLSGGLEKEREESYEQKTVGGELSLAYRFSLRNLLRGGVNITQNDVTELTEDPAFLEPPGRIASLFGEWRFDTSDDPLDPTRGSLTSVRVEWTPPGDFSENYFVKSELSSARYLRLPKGVVGAGRIGVGLGRPLYESIDLLPSLRFFSGGANTHRGFERRRLGPLDSAGNPIGGEANIEASTELRFKLVGILHGALFVDVGQVWSKRNDIDLRDLKLGVGPALMIKTPVGPIRLDVGYRVSEVDTDEPRWVFHFLIGNPY